MYMDMYQCGYIYLKWLKGEISLFSYKTEIWFKSDNFSTSCILYLYVASIMMLQAQHLACEIYTIITIFITNSTKLHVL